MSSVSIQEVRVAMTFPHLSSQVSTEAPSYLPPAVSYVLRRLLRQNLDRLLDDQGGTIADNPDFTVDPNHLLDRLPFSEEAKSTAVDELRKQVVYYQELTSQGARHRQDLKETEKQIFELLGLQLPTAHHNGMILIVDDTPENLRLLSSTLIQQGYEVRNAINGALALSRAQMIKPDLILLDVMMPGIDGYDVCRRLKRDPNTHDIPVIFISALDGTFDKVQAFSAGGVDYITKPFQIEEVLARIENQLNIWNLQHRLEEQNLRLQQQVQERQQTETRYRQLFDSAVDGFFQTNFDGQFIMVNLALAKMFGYESPEEFIQSVPHISHLYTQPGRHREFLNRLQRNGSIRKFESEVCRHDGQVLWISENACVIYNSDNQVVGYEGTVKNITDIRRAIAQHSRRRRQVKRLMLSVFPRAVAKQAIRSETPIAQTLDLSILIVDLQAISALWQEQSPQTFVTQFDRLIASFDRLAEIHGIDYSRTVGDRYHAITGIAEPAQQPTHHLAHFAIALQQTLLQQGIDPIRFVRMGMHQGPTIVGVLRERKLGYNLWGHTLTTVEAIANECPLGKIQVSEAIYGALREQFVIDRRTVSGFPTTRPRTTYWLIRAMESVGS